MTTTNIETTSPTAPQLRLSPALNRVGRDIRLTAYTGLGVMAIFFLGLGGWAANAPLDSAAIAKGFVAASSKRKTVQHLEGGIIHDILVREGEHVVAGQVLVKLDETQARANLGLLDARQRGQRALEARLVAERDDLPEIAFPSDITKATDDPNTAALINGQIKLFEARKRVLDGQLDLLKQKTAELNEVVIGAENQIRSKQREAHLLGEEIGTVSTLVDQGNATRPRLLALQRNYAEIQGQIAELNGSIAKNHQSVGEAELQMVGARNDRLKEVVAELRDTQNLIVETDEKVRAAQDVATRVDILAPQAGTVTAMHFFTPGGVIRAGEPILDIVPANDSMEIEAEVRPQDITTIHEHQKAFVRLTSYKARTTPTLDARVTYISADRVIEPRNGEAHYVAHVEIDPEQLRNLPDIELYPGAPAEVMVQTGERTALGYLTSAFTQSMNRAFREQ